VNYEPRLCARARHLLAGDESECCYCTEDDARDAKLARQSALAALGERLARQLPALEALASQPRNACVGDKSDAIRLIAEATRAAVGLGTQPPEEKPR
jgi:hypothetical protein